VFRLPRADTPARQVYFPPVVVIGRKGAPQFPAGSVLTTDLNSPQTVVTLDPISFRAAGPGTGLAPKAGDAPSSAKLDPLLRFK
jgi:hypothetical protein